MIEHLFRCHDERHAYACRDELLANGWAVEKIQVLPKGSALVHAHKRVGGEAVPAGPVPTLRLSPDQDIGGGLTAQSLHDRLQKLFAEE